MNTFSVYNSDFKVKTVIDCIETPENCSMIYKTPNEAIYRITFTDTRVFLDIAVNKGFEPLQSWKIKPFSDYCWKIQKTQIQTNHRNGRELYQDFKSCLIDDFGTCWVTNWCNYLIYGDSLKLTA